jgi:hypothetical protein
VKAATPPAGAGQGLEISPPLVERSVDPGQTLTFDIRLRNVTTGTLVTTSTIDDFVAKDESGQPKLLLDGSKETSPYTFKPWVQSIPSLSLVSQEAKTTTVVMHVPQDASPGGHYGVIRFSGAAPEVADTGVALSASIGTLVLINVSGDVKTSANIAELYASQNGSKGSFFEYGPLVLGIRIHNDGNVHVKPTGTLRVTNTFGRETAVLSVNTLGGNVLPQSTRKFEQLLDKDHMFGRYKVEANIQYSGKNLSQTMTFWVIPYKLLAIGLGIIILIIVGLRFGIRRYNQFIIAQASKTKAKASKKGKK